MVSAQAQPEFFGRGLYDVAEATQLARLPDLAAGEQLPTPLRKDAVRRWTKSILDRDFRHITGRAILSFLDVVELRVIARLVARGLSARRVRRAHERLRAHYDLRHPFASKRVLTDGHEVFFQNGFGVAQARDLQQVMDLVMGPFHDVSYLGEDGMASLWHPLGPDGQIVIDPQRRFGHPIVEPSGIPVDVIVREHERGADADEIAYWWEIDKSQIDAALQFHQFLTAMAQ